MREAAAAPAGDHSEGEGGTVRLQVGEDEQLEVAASAKVLEVDRQYAAFKVEPKPDEKGDPNFPPHLHAAFELFCMTQNITQAKRVKQCTDAFMALVAKGPDGTSSQSMGRAAVCWQCGYVGLPKNADLGGKGSAVAAKCGGCESDEQTNYVQCKQPDGSIVPWMENKTGDAMDKAKAAMGVAEADPSAVPSAAKEGQKAGAGAGKVKPNDPCPCGNGKKFKKCCGAYG